MPKTPNRSKPSMKTLKAEAAPKTEKSEKPKKAPVKRVVKTLVKTAAKVIPPRKAKKIREADDMIHEVQTTLPLVIEEMLGPETAVGAVAAEMKNPLTPMRITMITSEAYPYAKSGGLADVCAALPEALAERGHSVSVIMPYYPQSMKEHCAETTIQLTNLGVPLGSHEEWAQVRRIQVHPNLNFYFIEFNRYFDRPGLYDFNNVEYADNGERYIFFCRAAMEAIIALGLRPDILHTHDWHAALANAYLTAPMYRHSPSFRNTRSVLTIHNLGYHGNFDKGCLWLSGLGWEYFNQGCLEFYDRLNLLKGGIATADMVSTVSPTYAAEILSPEHGFQLDGILRHQAARGRLRGILNGIDTNEWNPAADPELPATFTADNLAGKAICKAELQEEFGLKCDPKIPLIGVVSRLAAQKGLDVFLSVIDGLLADNRAQIVVLGSGDPGLQEWVNHYARAYPGRFGAWIGYNNRLAHLIEAGADFFAMPSRYEPCGLNQMYSMRYGTLPIVRSTGGLEDTVVNYDPANLDRATGFKFYDLTGDALWNTLLWAIEVFEKYPEHIRRMQHNGMNTDFSWDLTAVHYEALYDDALKVEGPTY